MSLKIIFFLITNICIYFEISTYFLKSGSTVGRVPLKNLWHLFLIKPQDPLLVMPSDGEGTCEVWDLASQVMCAPHVHWIHWNYKITPLLPQRRSNNKSPLLLQRHSSQKPPCYLSVIVARNFPCCISVILAVQYKNLHNDHNLYFINKLNIN